MSKLIAYLPDDNNADKDRLVALRADLDWLEHDQGVVVDVIIVGNGPSAVAADDLPALMVDGEIVSAARYPSSKQLSRLMHVAGESGPTFSHLHHEGCGCGSC